MLRTRVLGLAAVSSALLVGLLAGCTGAPAQTPPPSETASPEPSAAPTRDPGAVLRPGESAAANQLFFDKVNSDFVAVHGMSDGRSLIDNLVAAGFLKQDMQVTPDRTAIDLPADTIVFSVRIKGECLIGQTSAAGYKGLIAPLLGSGSCLVGSTRPIDW